MQSNNLTTAAKVNWKNVSPHQKNELNKIRGERLLKIHIPNCITECRNVYCRNKGHVEAIDLHMCTFLGCINDNVKYCLPQTSGRNKKSITGWNDEVKPFREEAMFWHSLWISAGKPINNTLHNIMKKTRSVYHYQIRKCRKAVEALKRAKLLNACINGEGDIHELKKLRMVSRTVSKTMDGAKENVSEHFANVYERIYNSADDEEEIMFFTPSDFVFLVHLPPYVRTAISIHLRTYSYLYSSPYVQLSLFISVCTAISIHLRMYSHLYSSPYVHPISIHLPYSHLYSSPYVQLSLFISVRTAISIHLRMYSHLYSSPYVHLSLFISVRISIHLPYSYLYSSP